VKDSPEVAAARIEAERARAQALGSLRDLERSLLDLQQQLTPNHLMREAWEGAKSKSADLAEDAVDAVRARPLTATGVVAAIALFLAREPLMDLAGKLIDGVNEKRGARKRRKPQKKVQNTETVE
jgi:hypothetical protein